MRQHLSRPRPSTAARLAIGLLALLLTACVSLSDPEASQDQAGQVIGVVEQGQSAAQTFRARRSGLDGLWLWVSLGPGAEPAKGALAVELALAADPSTPLASLLIPYGDIAAKSPFLARFTPLDNSAGEGYVITLHPSQGALNLLGRGEDIYPDGTAWLNGAPLDADLAFRQSYRYGWGETANDVVRTLSNLWLVLPLLAVCLLPGWLLLDAFSLLWKLDGPQRITLAAGLSLALLPLAMLWTTLAGLRWNGTLVVVLAAAGGALALWRGVRKWRQHGWPRPDSATLALLAIFTLTLAVRLISVRDLAAPPWVDSVHHALLTRILMEQGQYPATYAPYLTIDGGSYHAGFHVLSAAFQWLSGLPLATGLLFFGQVLNASAVFSAYLFANSLSRSRVAALFTALIVGTLSPMPAYYTSWGRYTQLAALLILPACAWLIAALLQPSDDPKGERGYRVRPAALAALAAAGMTLIHYRVAAFFGLLAAVLLLAELFFPSAGQSRIQAFRRALLVIGGVALLAILFSLPWWPQTISTLLLPKLAAWPSRAGALFADFAWNNLTATPGQYSLALAALGLIVAWLRQRRLAFILTIWVLLLFVAANLNALGVPGGVFFNATAVLISLFLPIAALGGSLIAELAKLWERALPGRLTWLHAGGWLLGGAAGVCGSLALLTILNPVTFLARQADLDNMPVVESFVPPGEAVLVSPFAWGYNLYAGNDGGYWITPLTGRPTLPPPILYSLDNDSARLVAIREQSAGIIEAATDPARLAGLMRLAEVDYLFIGRRGGVFSPRALLQSPEFETLYHQSGVWLFRLRP